MNHNVLWTGIAPSCTNKSTISNPKNKVFETYKAKVKNLAEKQAEEIYKDREFGDEYQGVYTAASILKLVFSFASACTVFVALFWVLKPLLGIPISASISLAVCTILEILKGGVWSKLSKNVLKYKTYPIALVLAAVLFNLSSVGGSLLGAWQLPTMTESQQRANPTLSNIDSIRSSYTPLIAKIDLVIAEQSKAAKETSSNYTKVKLNETIKEQTAQKNAILEQQNEAILYAKEQNKAALSEHQRQVKKDKANKQKATTETQIKCVSIALLFEALLILCCCFISYYLFRVNIDRTETVESLTNGTENGATETANGGHQAPSTMETVTNPPIGFHKGENGNRHTQTETVTTRTPIGFNKGENGNRHTQTETVTNTKLEYTRICQYDGCKKPYIHGHNSQKYCSKECRQKANRKKNNKR